MIFTAHQRMYFDSRKIKIFYKYQIKLYEFGLSSPKYKICVQYAKTRDTSLSLFSNATIFLFNDVVNNLSFSFFVEIKESIRLDN